MTDNDKTIPEAKPVSQFLEPVGKAEIPLVKAPDEPVIFHAPRDKAQYEKLMRGELSPGSAIKEGDVPFNQTASITGQKAHNFVQRKWHGSHYSKGTVTPRNTADTIASLAEGQKPYEASMEQLEAKVNQVRWQMQAMVEEHQKYVTAKVNNLIGKKDDAPSDPEQTVDTDKEAEKKKLHGRMVGQYRKDPLLERVLDAAQDGVQARMEKQHEGYALIVEELPKQMASLEKLSQQIRETIDTGKADADFTTAAIRKKLSNAQATIRAINGVSERPKFGTAMQTAVATLKDLQADLGESGAITRDMKTFLDQGSFETREMIRRHEAANKPLSLD